MAHSREPDRKRLVLTLAVVLWISALAALFIGFRLKLKPVLLLGGLDAMLAMFVTVVAFSGRDRR